MPYLQQDLDSFPMIQAAAQQLQIHPFFLNGALSALWFFAWKTGDQFLTRRKLVAVTQIDHRELVETLVEYGFLEDQGDRVRVRGTKRYSKMVAAKSAAGLASAARRAQIKSGASATEAQQPLASVQRLGGRSDSRDPRSEIQDQKLLSPGGDPPVLQLQLSEAPKPADRDALVDLWNRTAAPELPRCRGIRGERAKKLPKLLEVVPLADWPALIANANASDFCRGMTGRGAWKLSLPGMLARPELALRVLENSYSNGKQKVDVRRGHVRAEDQDFTNTPIGEVRIP